VATGASAHVLIVAVDTEMHEFLDARGITHYFRHSDADIVTAGFNLSDSGRLAKIWAYRYAVLRALLVSGISVVQSDVDALFLRDPWQRIAGLEGDVVAQRGNFPFNIAKTWGATLCFGFIVYRATPATIAWFDLSFPRFLGTPDDQVSFQRALDICSRVVWNNGHTWPQSKDAHLLLKPRGVGKGDLNKVDYGVTEHPITAKGTRLRLVLLSFAEFPRRCGLEVGYPERQPGCLLAHCVAAKSGSSKVLDSRRRGLHFLKDGWEDELPASGELTSAFVTRLGNGEHPMAAKPASTHFSDRPSDPPDRSQATSLQALPQPITRGRQGRLRTVD
jgi:hypothetical protein